MKANELIIYSDVDGTLRSFDDAWDFINKKDSDAIKEFRNNGGYFSIATGRGINDLPDNIISLCNMPLVLLQGSYVYDHIKNEEVSNNNIDLPVKQRLLNYAKSDENVVMIFSSNEKKYIVDLGGNRPSPLGTTYTLCDEDLFLSKPALTIEFDTANEEEAKKVYKKLLHMNIEYMNVVSSAHVCVEVFKDNCSKSYGIKMAREYMNNFDNSLHKRKIACIGDYYNDVEMLKDANIAGTPKDSMDDIKRLCGIITCSTKEGAVSDFIKQCLSL